MTKWPLRLFWSSFGHWGLVIHWSLVIGHWSLRARDSHWSLIQRHRGGRGDGGTSLTAERPRHLPRCGKPFRRLESVPHEIERHGLSGGRRPGGCRASHLARSRVARSRRRGGL